MTKMMNKEIVIIGAGRLGVTLGYALVTLGYRIKAISCKHSSSASESLKKIGDGKAFTDNIEAAQEGELVFLCVPDSEITTAVAELSQAKLTWRGRFVFHCSGLISVDTLQPLKSKGAAVASFHPIQSFPHKKTDPKQFEGIYIALEGDHEALELAQKIAQDLQGRTIFIKGKDRPLY
jgi:predicted short-subunit dehydrogenase-like oxidoreductase (DUF2520 family)